MLSNTNVSSVNRKKRSFTKTVEHELQQAQAEIFQLKAELVTNSVDLKDLQQKMQSLEIAFKQTNSEVKNLKIENKLLKEKVDALESEARDYKSLFFFKKNKLFPSKIINTNRLHSSKRTLEKTKSAIQRSYNLLF